MINYLAQFINTNGLAFPDTLTVNASGPSATDGTEVTKNMMDDMWGARYALLDRAGISPNSIAEAPGASQALEATEKAFGVGPGFIVEPHLNPAVLVNYRVLIPQGQGVLRGTYDLLDAANYVGDANNAAVAAGGGAYFRADDAAGTSPNIAGLYLILPDLRGRVGRVEDSGATVDPDGASRFLGDNQGDTFQGHEHGTVQDTSSGAAESIGGGGNSTFVRNLPTVTTITDGVNGTPRTSTETRMANYSTKKALVY